MRIFKKYCSTVNMKQLVYYKTFLTQQFNQSVSAVNPTKLVADNLKLDKQKLHVCDKVYQIQNGHIYLVGFGKAVLGMASQCERILKDRLKRGVICVPENIRDIFQKNEFSLISDSVIEVHEGARNNLPDEKAEKGADEIISLVQSLDKEKDILIVLISGGGSALFPKPKPGITLSEKFKTIVLLASLGADIVELNSVRKKLSIVKGGGLACMSYPTRTISLILSDVINNPLDIIASGPTVPNLDSENTPFDIIQKYGIQSKLPENVVNILKKPSCRYSIPVEDHKFSHVDNYLIGTNTMALNAAKEYSERFNFKCVILTNKINGLVSDVSDFYINLVYDILISLHDKKNVSIHKAANNNFDLDENFINDLNNIIQSGVKQICVIAGGETTVKVQGSGKGGRNQELALILSKKLYDLKINCPLLFRKYEVLFLSAGTDGIDGPTDAAGALGEASVIDKAVAMNLNPDYFLENNDSYNFFQSVDGGSYLIKTGHTGTNVMDIHSLVIYQKELST